MFTSPNGHPRAARPHAAPPAQGTSAQNVSRGATAACHVFLVVGLTAFPNGPFIRPHPALWRLVLGVSVLYWLGLILLLFPGFLLCRPLI